MANCKTCGTPCDVKISKSDKNPGKEFWSCPNRCKGWNGWVDETPKTSNTSGNYNSTTTNDDRSNTTNDTSSAKPTKRCPKCGMQCKERTSKTPKNFGKKFWACPKNCEGWIGWVGESFTLPSQTKSRYNSSSDNKLAESSKKRKIETAPTTQPQSSHKPKIPQAFSITYHCIDCDKVLDIEHEIANHLRRYQINGEFPTDMISMNLKAEIQEAISNEDYTCEACQGNE